jgi:uncharacterized phage-associated protein
MANVHDVAAHILKARGPMTAMKLEKLVYYCQAWSLVWDEKPLFDDPIQAWVNGPVSPTLYAEHRGRFEVGDWPKGDPSLIDEDGIETANSVLEFYGAKTSQWLSDLTHTERPWLDARRGLAPGARAKRDHPCFDGRVLRVVATIDGGKSKTAIQKANLQGYLGGRALQETTHYFES